MEERIEISILLDIYGDLLTDKQKDIMSLYFNEDFSLAEIAELNLTSRQAIHDLIKRCNKVLLDYEKRLGLMKKNLEVEKIKKTIINKLDSITDVHHDPSVINIILDIRNEIIEKL